MSVSRVSNATAAPGISGIQVVTPPTVTVSSGTASVSQSGTVSFSGVSTLSLSNCFSSNYTNYRIGFNLYSATPTDIFMYFRENTTDKTAGYWGGANSATYVGSALTGGANDIGYMYLYQSHNLANYRMSGFIDIYKSANGVQGTIHGTTWNAYNYRHNTFTYTNNTMSSFNGISLTAYGTTMIGSLQMYGYVGF